MANPTEIERTAYHEAAHAVVALDYGSPVKRITIVAGDGYLGMVEHRLSIGGRPDIEMTPRMVDRIERKIIIAMAGHIAEKRLAGRHNWRSSKGDFAMIVDLGSRLYEGKVLDKYVGFLWERAKWATTNPFAWFRIRYVAKLLLKRQTLTGEQLVEAVDEAAIWYDKRLRRKRRPIKPCSSPSCPT